MKHLVLIDGNAILHRAFYALPDTITLKDGTPVNAVYGFTSMLLRIVQDLEPYYLICAFDLPEPTFRDQIYEDYRAQRPPTPEKLVDQVELTKDVVRAFGIPIYEEEGYEADDVIGSLASQARNLKSKEQKSKRHRETDSRTIGQSNNEAIEVIIVSGDRDLLQLVDEHIRCYMPVRGLSEAKMYGVVEVGEKYGIHPEQMVDYKALVGDPSDNYLGVKGIGPKTAVKLLEKYGTLEEIYQKLSKETEDGEPTVLVSKKISNALRENREDAMMAKELAQIVTDVPVELDPAEAKLGDLANSDVEALFKELEFKTLWGRVKKTQKEETGNSGSDKKPVEDKMSDSEKQSKEKRKKTAESNAQMKMI